MQVPVARNLDAWLDHIAQQNWQAIDMGLERMHAMVRRLDLTRPANRVVTVAGTNGKGSTCMALERMLISAGLRVGTTLSPHIRRFNERIRLFGEEATDDTICRAFAAVESERGDLGLTYFEYSALAALWLFREASLDVAILEIGLGGRLDAFNAVDADIALITSIGLDHQAFLGDTLDAIGAEKAGILRPGQQVVTGPDMPSSVRAQCAALQLEPLVYGRDFSAQAGPGGGEWAIRGTGIASREALPAAQLPVQNIALAYAAASGLLADPAQLDLSDTCSQQMCGRMEPHARLDRLWVCDVAHNPAGMTFLADNLALRGIRISAVICGMLKDKAHAEVAQRLQTSFPGPLVLIDTHGDRALPAEELREAMGVDAVCCATAEQAMEVAVSATQPGSAILICGSFSTLEQFVW